MLRLIIMRGLPGSGKSTTAESFGGKIFTTDDFFMEDGEYRFDITKIGQAHEWNQLRAFSAMEAKEPIVVIDNTNTQFWEMKPYVEKGIQEGYRLEFAQPETPWAWDVETLAERNTHGVPEFAIERMKERFEQPISIRKILASKKPF